MSDGITEARRGTYFSDNTKIPLWKTEKYTQRKPKKYKMISYIKSSLRIIGYSFIPFNLGISIILLIISEMLNIIQYIFYPK